MFSDARVIAVDVDGTLTHGVAWTVEDAENAIPRLDMIARVNEVGKTKCVIIWTARRDHLMPATIQWLRENGVKYQAITNNKLAADVYLDDHAMQPEAFLQSMEGVHAV